MPVKLEIKKINALFIQLLFSNITFNCYLFVYFIVTKGTYIPYWRTRIIFSQHAQKERMSTCLGSSMFLLSAYQRVLIFSFSITKEIPSCRRQVSASVADLRDVTLLKLRSLQPASSPRMLGASWRARE